MNFEQWLAANGYDVAAINLPENAKQRKHLEAAWKAETATPPIAEPVVKKPAAVAPTGTQTPYEVELEAARKESDRQRQICDLTSEQFRRNVAFPDRIERFEMLRDCAIKSNWTVQKFEYELLKEHHSLGPIISVPSGEQMTNEVLEAAVCQAAGLQDIEKHFGERTLDSAHKQFRGGVGLLQLVGACARRNGWRGDSVKSDLRGALRAAFRESDDGNPQMMAIGPSTLSVSGILSNIANKFLRVSFEAVESAWRQVAATRPVNDFKTITTYSLTGDLQYEKVAPGGEIKHGTLGETSYTNKADTYAKLIGIDRRDLINDDLSAFASASRRLGRGAALKVNDVFYTVYLADSNFFNTDKSKNNYDDGATDSVLSLAGLENARTIFMQQTDPDGKPLGSMPRILFVPITLGVTARNLMNGLFTAAAQSTATVTTENVFKGMFTIVESTYLCNSAYSGYSATAWYLLADPADIPVVEIVFLNGQQMPTIETAELDFNRLGIALRGYHDFGVALQEYRGGVKLKGAA
ncbi:MAG TPA: Mu-like prophage major head subunit gpT family protein [Gemmataceae bacterium]|nr:Mu-like prophage major head subunit gpT family protein [Gemmataceae bacterium]